MTTTSRPECFGDLDQVFPMTGDGLRHSPGRCLGCIEKSHCLKSALAGNKQLVLASEKLDRTYHAGKMSFLRRWSEKKMLDKRRRKNQNQQHGAC